MNKYRELTPEQEQRLLRIADRVIEAIPEERRQALILHDARMVNLKRQIEDAKRKNRFTSISIIQRQMAARIQEIYSDEASRIIYQGLKTGDIAMYLDDDQHEAFNTIRARYFLCMDVLNTVLNDMSGILYANGLQGECKMLRDIEQAKKAIDEWCHEGLPILHTAASQIALDESDNIYSFLCKRTDIMNRKAVRVVEKSLKASAPE